MDLGLESQEERLAIEIFLKRFLDESNVEDDFALPDDDLNSSDSEPAESDRSRDLDLDPKHQDQQDKYMGGSVFQVKMTSDKIYLQRISGLVVWCSPAMFEQPEFDSNRKKKTLASYWTTRPSQATPIFNSVMTYDEFVLISRMVHLNYIAREIERVQEGHDPWSKLRQGKECWQEEDKVLVSRCKVGCHLQFVQRLRHVTDQGLQKRRRIQQQV
ncbi:hypothetical protein PoB_000687300 [Plakobranchus ocellatus]|uniref:PiggyBac transposable element-derived protein domain-containing protein n=1 Tax=Plakobranchus ocellatus TaxID=259542 RepID=A0AAV3YD52_9GAST|nr:hypothetical protein PoB_000687300 [Plakobranchus ocellatus]